MLKSIDVLIGLVVVLLALSMAVTVITQAITTILNSRGRHLRRGLTDLLQQLDPALTPAISGAVATRILTHPLVSGSNTPLASEGGAGVLSRAVNVVRRVAGGPRLGNVVHREEFTKLLMALGGGEGSIRLDQAAEQALTAALANNGVADPKATLAAIRTLSLQLERSSPELSNMARQNLATLHAAQSDLVAKINNWFDQTMDRTSQRFTASTRAITFAGAFVVAFVLQVDTPALVNRLAADAALRAAFVEQAQLLQQQREDEGRQAEEARSAEAATGSQAAPAPQEAGPGNPGQPAAVTDHGAVDDVATAKAKGDAKMAREYRAFLAANGVVTLPSYGHWMDGYSVSSCLGMLVTALLLSLGAPFWYSALARLLQLRSVLATKEQGQRTERQSNEPPPAATVEVRRSTAPPALPGA